MIIPEIDEFTLVLQSEINDSLGTRNWDEIAEEISLRFINQTHLIELFGDYDFSVTGLAGYTEHIVFPLQPFGGFSISWNSEYKQMGIAVSFSASSWLYYQKYYIEKFKERVTVPVFLRLCESNKWTSRLSRIDLLVDYQDEGLNVDSIYNSVNEGRAHILQRDGRKNMSKQETITSNGIVETFYLGSRAKNTRIRFRLYDKKIEQIAKGRSALRLNEAEKLVDWVRLEVSFKKEYAHQLHEKLIKISSDSDLKDLILNAILDKYQFYYIKSEKMMKHTSEMKKLLNDDDFNFTNPNIRAYELEKMMKYQVENGGLFSLMHKLDATFGSGTSKEFILWFYDEYYNTYIQTESDAAWLNKYKTLYINEYYDGDEMEFKDMPWQRLPLDY